MWPGIHGNAMTTHTTSFRLLAAPLFAALVAACPPARAQTDDGPSAICTDRPTKSNAACVVDPGHFQYETDLINGSRLHVDGTTVDTWLATNPTFKYGIAKSVDVEVNVSPWEVVRTHDGAGDTSILRGPGDTYVRVKWNFFSGLDDKLTIAAIPYVKAPTARHGIGNGALESGIIVPVNYQLTDKLVLTTVPEFDSLKDGDGVGHHFNTAQLVNVAYSLPHDLTVYGELWGDWNVDPSGTVRQYSADVALAWAFSKTLQFDVGFNAGLNRNTPRVQGYVGVSQKF